ncbi:MAG: tRNA pseudouridine(55) synthase TruB [Pseudomonadaceae bacterium]|nr:tRNA pseudouridine(55) synthase TruB [Pseudomonadaceae bacterium]
MSRRRKGRPVNGLLVVDKPKGMSSNDAVQRAKRLFGAAKVGHTGSLDPLATGVLPLCFGEATKFSQYLLSSEKTYWVRIRLGERTDTSDSEGEIIATRPTDGVTSDDVERELDAFRGDIMQVPSMYSALKHNGQPLYKLARQGIEVEREARAISVYRNDLLSHSGDDIELHIHCSKGTYVRTIADDLGEALGCGAHVTELRRLGAGPFTEEDLITFEDLEAEREKGSLDHLLQPVRNAVRQWPAVELDESSTFYVRQGQPVLVPKAPSEGWVQLLAEDAGNSFLGVGEVLDDGRIAPRRLVV